MAGRALVLGGGGVTGVAWELGVIAGLADKGIDLRTADLMVGTSAGSVVGAQITTGTSAEELYQQQLASTGSEVAEKIRLRVVARYALAALRGGGEQEILRRVGDLALRTKTMPQAERKAIIASRLPRNEWPAQRLLITAIVAKTGEFTVFDRDSGVSLVDAVAASCAVPGVWPPSDVNGELYMDGGIRSLANVDIIGRQSASYDRVVVIAPLTASFRRAAAVATQVAALPAGTRCVVVSPDDDAKAVIGRDLLNPARRAGAARAGRRQGTAVATTIEAIWS
jgi:NTE family protein